MTTRTKWPMVAPAGTKTVGTARVRDEQSMPYAQKKLAEKFGTRPAHGFDDIADGASEPGARTPAYRREALPSLGMAKPTKAPKYRNTKCEHDGIKFDSKREMSRWFDLIQQQAAGLISELELQVPFVLAEPVVIAGRKRPALRYFADFVYKRAGQTVVEDSKGRVTEGYRIKRHLMKAVFGIDIQEV